MGSRSSRRGHLGEEYAAAWLQGQGAQILERNWRCPAGEVDIIAKMGEYLCFVEVKARQPHSLGAPEEAVGREKRRRIIQSAEHYLYQCPQWTRLQPRFDIAALILGEGEQVRSFSYLPGAFGCDDL